MTSLNDTAWDRVFLELGLLDEIERVGCARISATTLKEVGQREPRLMAKQDTLESRPALFRRHHLAILPVKNGEYVIFRDSRPQSYYSFDASVDEVKAERHDSSIEADRIQTLSLGSISTEFQAIDFAHLASVLRTFTSEPTLSLTIRGRYRSNRFSVTLPGIDEPVEINGVQIEIDSGFEGENGVYLIGAKLGKRADFHIRQLYYPWKDWSTRTDKPVVPIFFSYSNGLFYLTRFRFGEQYGDIEIVEHRCFSVNEDPVLSVDLDALLASVPPEEAEPRPVPYPQANDLDKVIDLIVSSNGDPITKESISDYFEFDVRQGDYYADAAIYMGFLNRDRSNRGSFVLTDLGTELQGCRTRRCRNHLLVRQLLRRPTLRQAITRMRERGFVAESVEIQEIMDLIDEFDGRYNTTTRRRRASTVRSWLQWLSSNVHFS
ncbi:MAG: hypothetical protein AB7S61_08645 [Methanoregulaceae archaeon]